MPGGAYPPTPGGADASEADEEVAKWEQEVARLVAAREAISRASGADDGERPLLCSNHASALANAMRLLDAARRKKAKMTGVTPPTKA